MRTLTSLAAVLILASAAPAAEPVGVIVQFNGKKVGDVEASTKDKGFKAVFEKDLKDIAARLPGKPELALKDWFTIINGASVRWGKVEKGVPEKLKAELEKLPYVQSVELDVPVPPPER
jgi:hypothetical protein